MKTKDKYYTQNLFFGNYFCIIEKYRLAFVAISKNAVTSLKNIAIWSKEGFIPENEDDTHAYIGFSPEKGFLIPVCDMPEYEMIHGHYIKFAIWRDPVQRLYSCYKWFCINKKFREYFLWTGLYDNIPFNRFIDFATFELGKKESLSQDEHIRPQCKYYNINQVDYIVPIEYMNIFLEQNGIEKKTIIHSNKSPNIRLDIDKEQIKRIQELYEQDYYLLSEKSKIWTLSH